LARRSHRFFNYSLSFAALHVGADGGSDDDLRPVTCARILSRRRAAQGIGRWSRRPYLAIAKFPKYDDVIPVTLLESVTLQLALKAGIPIPDWRVEKVAGRDVLLLRRFDRRDDQRIPFLSAMSLLNATDNEPRSYMEIADALRQHDAKADEDCAQLWRRIVFNILVSNTEDHLRNHGFLYDPAGGWRISPVYDVNPVPIDIKPRILTTAIDEADGTASLELALQVSSHFGVKPDKAKDIAREVGKAVARWRETAEATGLSASEIERMASAFEHDELAAAIL
jgi:serine/threonine-protein kinase HipA